MRHSLLRTLTIIALCTALMLGACGQSAATGQDAGAGTETGDGDDGAEGDTVESAGPGTEGTVGADTGSAGTAETGAEGTAAQTEYDSPALPGFECTQAGVHEVDGRQGIAWGNGVYYVSGSGTLSAYDADWNRIAENSAPFAGMETTANHLGDIDAYGGEIYAGAEYFNDGEASDIRIAVYDGTSLQLKRTIPFDPERGQTECSGIAVDPDNKAVWLCSWGADESGRFLYRYDMKTGAYAGKIELKDSPQWIQGAAYFDGWIYLTADDGSADEKAPDHVYRCRVDLSQPAWDVVPVYTLDDVVLQGEIEGISFDQDRLQMLVCYNRGSRIVQGMVTGYYEGYTEEIHEVYVYDLKRIFRPLDYARDDLWVERPVSPDKKADIFMVMPSVNMKRLTADNEDVYNLRNVLRFTLTCNMERGLVADAGNVYIPLYRQMTIGAALEEDGRLPATIPAGEFRNPYLDQAYQDVRDAFLYYRENLGEGRPFVLFGYSQGALLIARLMEEFGEDPAFSGDLVAAYAIGTAFTDRYLEQAPYVKMAQGETDTGVVVSFNVMDENAELPDTHEYAINPLNWKTDSTKADPSSNLGYANVNTYGKVTEEIPAYCGAWLDEKTGKLLVTGIDGQEQLLATDSGVLHKGDYHLYDLTFFYRNIQKNVADRIGAFTGE